MNMIEHHRGQDLAVQTAPRHRTALGIRLHILCGWRGISITPGRSVDVSTFGAERGRSRLLAVLDVAIVFVAALRAATHSFQELHRGFEKQCLTIKLLVYRRAYR